MLVVSALQALVLLALLAVHGRSGLPIVYGVIVAQSTLAALFDPAKNALLPMLVAARASWWPPTRWWPLARGRLGSSAARWGACCWRSAT